MDPDIEIEDEAWHAVENLEALAKRAVVQALALVNMTDAQVALNFADDETLASLNAQWRGKPKPTNVLSFPAGPGMTPPDEPTFLGDVILASGVTKAEAQEQGKSWEDHTTHLIIHGVLHLAGHDHETEDEAAVMEALEIRAMAALGLANPYE
jgi:probable rRNA maturation factor